MAIWLGLIIGLVTVPRPDRLCHTLLRMVESVMMPFMADENVLIERDLTIPHKRVNYEIKVRAIFEERDHLNKTGRYQFSFESWGIHCELFQPNRKLWTRENAKEAAKKACDSGSIEQYVKSQIENWIFLHGLEGR